MTGVASFLLVVLGAPKPGAADVELVGAANRHYAAAALAIGDANARALFATAASEFEELVARGYESAALYRDLGHASLRAGDPLRALLAYAVALRLDPCDDRARRAAAVARKAAGLESEGDDGGWEIAMDARCLVTRLGVRPALVLYALGCALVGVGRLGGRRRWVRIGFVLAGPAALLAVLSAWPRPLSCPLIVVQEVMPRRGDGPSYPPRRHAPLRRGDQGECLTRRGAWVQAEFGDGSVGWLPATATAVLDRGAPACGSRQAPAP